ncbi:MAG: GGDEF domain-containing protein [Acidobacteriota bacterium]
MTPAQGEVDPRTLETSTALVAIERERFRSYSPLVRNLHWLAATLVVLYGVLTPNANRLFLGGLAGGMVLYTLALHSRLFSGLPMERRVWLEAVLDLAWITAVVLVSGSTLSPLIFLYYLVIYASTPAIGRLQTYLKAGAATLLILGVSFHLDLDILDIRAAVASVIWPLMGLWLVAYFFAESSSLGADLQRSLYLAAHTDALTGLPNLRHFTAMSDLRGKLAKPYTIVMVDADHLKRVNDTYGHAHGNDLIRTVAEALRNAARGDDLCSRIGGDEFIVRLEGATREGGMAYCRRARTYLAEHPLRIDGVIVQISVSMGLAAYPEHGKRLSEVTERADQALYVSKREGRSRDHIWAA